jgi:hypothetical protein
MPSTAAGPFYVGDRVSVEPYRLQGEITAVGETQAVRVSGINIADPAGEVHHVTFYAVRLDNGQDVEVADRDGILSRAG